MFGCFGQNVITAIQGIHLAALFLFLLRKAIEAITEQRHFPIWDWREITHVF
jgi:hypothetical protein